MTDVAISISGFKRAARSAFSAAPGNSPHRTARVEDQQEDSSTSAKYTRAAQKYALAAARAARIARFGR